MAACLGGYLGGYAHVLAADSFNPPKLTDEKKPTSDGQCLFLISERAFEKIKNLFFMYSKLGNESLCARANALFRHI